MSLDTRVRAASTQLLLLALVTFLGACSKPAQPSVQVFSSPDDAGNALLQAGKSGDPSALREIFGPDSKDLIYSGDAVQDKTVVDAFVSAYEVMHRWRKMPDGAQILVVGADNFPFPIPLRQNGAQRWFFDTAAGKDEVLSRRVGRNELAVIEVCAALADAQAEYFGERHDDGSTGQYALKFISDASLSRMACTGNPRKATPEVRSGHWRHLLPTKDIT